MRGLVSQQLVVLNNAEYQQCLIGIVSAYERPFLMHDQCGLPNFVRILSP